MAKNYIILYYLGHLKLYLAISTAMNEVVLEVYFINTFSLELIMVQGHAYKLVEIKN